MGDVTKLPVDGPDLIPHRTNETGEIYYRLKGESGQAYEAFQVYRDLGLGRSQKKAAKQLGKHPRLLGGWSSKWSWMQRVQRYDADEEQQFVKGTRELRKRQRVEDAETARRIKKAVAERLESIDPKTLTPNQLIKWYEVGVKMERLSLGDSSEIETEERREIEADDFWKKITENPKLAGELAREISSASGS
jgi:hypothetical protein